MKGTKFRQLVSLQNGEKYWHYWGLCDSFGRISGDCSVSPISSLPSFEFTGRVDCNGKDIYEGDIVKWRGAKGTGNYGNNVIVAWNPKTAGFGFYNGYGFSKLSKSGFATFSTVVTIEVLGNTSENQELLKEVR